MYRTLTNLLFSIIIVANSFHLGRGSANDSHIHDDQFDHSQSSACKAMSFITQFAMFTGECWLLTFSVDLVSSLTNPFSSYKANLKKYHFFVWIGGFLNALALVGNPSCQGLFSTSAGICWMQFDSANSSCFWGYYAGW